MTVGTRNLLGARNGPYLDLGSDHMVCIHAKMYRAAHVMFVYLIVNHVLIFRKLEFQWVPRQATRGKPQ